MLLLNKQVAQLSQRDRATAVGQFWSNVKEEILQSRSIFSQCDVVGLQAIEFSEITQNKGYAVQGHSRSPMSVSIESTYATSFLLVINTN